MYHRYLAIKLVLATKLNHLYTKIKYNKAILIKGSTISPYDHPSYTEEHSIKIKIDRAHYEKGLKRLNCLYKL